MTNETRKRIKAYRRVLPGMREKVAAAMSILLIASIVSVTATYAWMTISRAPAVQNISTVLAANGSLEIALSKEDGSLPDEFDVDESVTGSRDITVTNLQWGNLLNLSDASYGIDNLALRPALLNETTLLKNPLSGAVYGSDGRITGLTANCTYVKYRNGDFFTSNAYGVRAIASYTATISQATKDEYTKRVQAISVTQNKVYSTYDKVWTQFSPLADMLSAYAQDNLDNATPGTDHGQYLNKVINCYVAVYDAMLAQKDAYVALANFQRYMKTQNDQDFIFKEVTWEQLVQNKAAYNAADANSTSTDTVISLVGLTAFINDLATMEKDLNYLRLYYQDWKANNTPYYWNQKGEAAVAGPNISAIISDLIDINTMHIYIDGNKYFVTQLGTLISSVGVGGLLGMLSGTQDVFIDGGVMKRFEQTAVLDSYRISRRPNNANDAACEISIKYMGIPATVKGRALTTASGQADFAVGASSAVSNSILVPNDAVADDTYGLVVDFWTRTNIEQTCLILEGATVTDEQGNILRYDGVNRIWNNTGDVVLTTDSTTQGGGSCYIYYADTPEDMMRSLELLTAMKVAFVDQNGNLLAEAGMDTEHYSAVNGRITVPLVLDPNSVTSYTYTNELNEQVTAPAITNMYADSPIRISTIVYLDGTLLNNDNVLSSAEIQGQLNIQFGSSAELKTIGSNELIDDTRYATATADRNELDYDNSLTAADLTAGVTVNIHGTKPKRVEAFFVRAINSTQGSREELMRFTELDDGSWASSYQFKSPGIYYLRYVRLDGVDYPLAEPVRVEVKGYALKSVTWGEAGNAAVIRTSADSYTESVSVAFASNDRTKLPRSVSAQFMREDGNVVRVPLSYSTSSGEWSGRGTFTLSGVYTLQYLIIDGKQTDLGDMAKTLNLSLGMYVTVEHVRGELTHQYESGQVYSKDVRVEIFDNAGKELTKLENATLFYTNGGSATGLPPVDLIWNEVTGYYEATLPLANAGRYRFSAVYLEGNELTKCTESPVYTLFSPDPPEFDTSSEATYHDSIQFAPLTNDAVIDNIKIHHAESVAIKAVVYNEVSGKYQLLDSERGEVYFTGSTWCIKLPTYTTDLDADGNPVEGAVYTQEGKWHLVCLMLSDCYDASSEYRDDSKPIIWAGNDSISSQYLTNSHLTADQRYDFSKLSTEVSCSLQVTMVPGSAALGSSSDAFMSRYPVKNIGMYVVLTDGAGNIIPSSKVGNVVLNVKYTPDANNSTYGYKVLSSAEMAYKIELNNQDAENGHRTVSRVNDHYSDYDWQYVGVYSVQNLQVTIGGITKTYRVSDNIGLPERYTVTTRGPSEENIALLESNVTQNPAAYTIGKTGENVTGTFLGLGDLRVTAKVVLTTEDNSDTRFVKLEGVTVQLVLTHQGGSQANGGYTFTPGTSQYESITLNMTDNGGAYVAPATTLLAGNYKVAVKATIGSGKPTSISLHDVSVYSKQPTLKVTGVSPSTTEQFMMNPVDGKKLYSDVESSLLSVQNYYSDYLANVYIKTDKWEQTVGGEVAYMIGHSVPSVTLALSNAGAFTSAQVIVPNAANSSYNKTYTFSQAAMTQTSEIGGYEQKEQSASEAGLCGGSNEKVYWHVPYNAGEQRISEITLYDSNNIAYTVTLSNQVTIRETNVAPPSISFAEESGYHSFEMQVSQDGGSFTIKLPTAAEFGSITKETSEITGGTGWGSPVQTTETKYCYATCVVKDNKVSNGCNGSTTYKYGEFTYYLFTRYQRTYKQTTSTKFYSTTTGLIGWKIGDTVYSPGQTITVSSAVTAVPVIGELSKVYLREEVVTMVHTTIQDVPNNPATSTSIGNKEAVKTEDEARKQYVLPNGYTWFNTADPYDASKVIREETQYGEDYRE